MTTKTITRRNAAVSTAVAVYNALEAAYQMDMQPTFKLDLTRRVYAVDAITGARTAHLVRDFTLVG